MLHCRYGSYVLSLHWYILRKAHNTSTFAFDSAVVPSVPFYLHYLGAPSSFLGLVVSFYSLGQFIGSPAAGWLNDRVESKTLLTLSSLIGLVASTFYAVAPNQWYILLSRVMTGVSAGMEFTTELAFIARNTTNEERTTFLASVTAVNVLGFIMVSKNQKNYCHAIMYLY